MNAYLLFKQGNIWSLHLCLFWVITKDGFLSVNFSETDLCGFSVSAISLLEKVALNEKKTISSRGKCGRRTEIMLAGFRQWSEGLQFYVGYSWAIQTGRLAEIPGPGSGVDGGVYVGGWGKAGCRDGSWWLWNNHNEEYKQVFKVRWLSYLNQSVHNND